MKQFPKYPKCPKAPCKPRFVRNQDTKRRKAVLNKKALDEELREVSAKVSAEEAALYGIMTTLKGYLPDGDWYYVPMPFELEMHTNLPSFNRQKLAAMKEYLEALQEKKAQLLMCYMIMQLESDIPVKFDERDEISWL